MIGSNSHMASQGYKTSIINKSHQITYLSQHTKSGHYANLRIKKISTPKGPTLNLPQKSKC